MGEMKVEHILLFLVGAFLAYHMMKGCECNKVEGMSDYSVGSRSLHGFPHLPHLPYLPHLPHLPKSKPKPKPKPKPKSKPKPGPEPNNIGGNCSATQYGCCPGSEGIAAKSYVDRCLPRVVDEDGMTSTDIRAMCPSTGETKSCYSDGQRCVVTEKCLHPEKDEYEGGGGIVKEDGTRTKCRLCGFGDRPDCPRGVRLFH